MWDKITGYFRKREAREFSEHATVWHNTCVSITDACIDALNNETTAQTDIGVTLDRADKMLFAVRDHLSALGPALDRRDRILAKRVRKASEQLYEVRNKTAKFLIRAQGPVPHFLRSEAARPETQLAYHYQAMENIGFEARKDALELRKELKDIWTVMHVMITEADETVRGYSF